MRKEREKEEKLKKIKEELKKKLAEQQTQIKKMLEEVEKVRTPQIFDGTSSRVSEFIEECRRYIKEKMKEEKMEDQIYWIISYIQGRSTDEWKKRIVDKIFENKQKDRHVEEILQEIEKEFEREKKKEKKKIWENLEEGF